MPTRTIYVKDETLWKEAKKLAGDEGLSHVIGKALAEFVEWKRAETEGFERFRIAVDLEQPDELVDDAQEPRHRDRIAFEGKRLLSAAYELDKAIDGWSDAMLADLDRLEVSLEVFRTRSGKLVLTADTSAAAGGVLPKAVTHWRDCDSLGSLSQDRIVQALRPADRAALLDEVSAAVGEDWARWID